MAWWLDGVVLVAGHPVADYLLKKMISGLTDATTGSIARAGEVLFDKEMPLFEKWLYINDPSAVLWDFTTGVLIDMGIDGAGFAARGLFGNGTVKGEVEEQIEDAMTRSLKEEAGEVVEKQAADALGNSVEQGIKGGSKTIPYAEYDNIYKSSIHNSNAEKVMLGKYDGNGPTGYIAQAGDDYTYFSIDDWEAIKNKYNFTDDDMFSLFNEAFLDDGINEGKIFQFSHNPIGDEGALGKEFEYLLENNYLWDEKTMTMRPY